MQLFHNDKEFKRFVLSYIGSSADDVDLEEAKNNAQKRCPRGANSLCKAIEKASSDALQGSGGSSQ